MFMLSRNKKKNTQDIPQFINNSKYEYIHNFDIPSISQNPTNYSKHFVTQQPLLDTKF